MHHTSFDSILLYILGMVKFYLLFLYNTLIIKYYGNKLQNPYINMIININKILFNKKILSSLIRDFRKKVGKIKTGNIIYNQKKIFPF